MSESIGDHLPPYDHLCHCGLALPAHRLANGAQILALWPTRRADYAAVLSLDTTNIVTPFVTYLADPGGHVSTGHWFPDLAEAFADLARRSQA